MCHMENDNNPREELYRRFRKALTRPVGERFFDEDELIDIYDYAGDYNDDYVQLEVLLCGARLYPESERLAERKALLYLDTTDDETDERTKAAQQYLADNPEASSILFDIARMEVNPPQNPEEALEFLLNQYSEFDDEEIIRFVDLAVDLDCYKWLIANFESISAKVPYKPSFQYEVAREADKAGDNETLIRLADALIETEPFAPAYWLMLLRGQCRLARHDDARQTFEYARALAEDDQETLFALIDIAYNFEPELLRDLIEPLKRLATANPDEFYIVESLCAIYNKLNYNEAVVRKTLRDFLLVHPENATALAQYLNLNVPDKIEIINKFFESTDSGALADADYDTLSHTLCSHGDFAAAEIVLARCLNINNCDDPFQLSRIIEVEIHLAHYGQVIEVCKNNALMLDGLVHDPLHGPAAVYALAVSLIKTGHYNQALSYVKSLQPFYEGAIKMVPLPVRMTIRCLLTFIDKIERHPAEETMYWEFFDMLFLGKA